MKLYRPATVLVGILFVLLGGLTRLAEPDQVYDESNRVVTKGTIGETLPYYGSTVTVHRMKFARAYLTGSGDDKAVPSSGIYVAIEYSTERGTEKNPNPSPDLITDAGTVYQPIGETWGGNIDFDAPGFGVDGAIVFEVNPADVKGLTLRVRTTLFYNVLMKDLAFDLGVPDDKAAKQLIDTATPEFLIPHGTKRVAS